MGRVEKLQPNSSDRTRDNENKLKTTEFSLSMWKLLFTVRVTEQVTSRACGDSILGNTTQLDPAPGTLLCLSLL